ncbi:MAG: dihydroneopterin aldolase [Verrucomicrobia bacterium]|nr:dihydroneopterin aldolase [Verrucomicrobiota bacterium]MBU4248584.1 dihydroneopterin aldolase [Verrucomicrobiota bacterium]MBU4290524.1 dihydroneopterin aldolase [Verrucomicrobiota bacterium]MBU4429137.1 dihydroneopterin aldolase [Verrucomicrobiota bacterium]MCG2680703.1 dihydroneopterin aldolase [Kiritimatiellia bacterium]
MDSIHIRQLPLECIIGVESRERQLAQHVIISISVHGDFREAGVNDRLQDAVDYVALRDRIVALVENSRFHLIEALAQAVADICLAEKRIVAADVVVEKPGAFSGHGAVAVEIHRAQA